MNNLQTFLQVVECFQRLRHNTTTYFETASSLHDTWQKCSLYNIWCTEIIKICPHHITDININKTAFQSKAVNACIQLCVFTSGCATKIAVTPFNPLKTHAACKLHGCMFYRQKLLLLKVLHCRNRNFRPFWLL